MAEGLPNQIEFKSGKQYVLVLLKVQDIYEDGTPLDLTLLKDSTSVELVGGEKFITAYIDAGHIKG